MRALGPPSVSLHPRSDYRLSCFPQTRRGRRGQGWGPGADSAVSRSAARLPKLRALLGPGRSARSSGAAAAGERCGGRMKAAPCSGGPGREGNGPSRSRGLGRGSLGRGPGALRARRAAGLAGPEAAWIEAGARGRGRRRWGGRAGARRLQGVCTEAELLLAAPAVDWFYSPGIRPALPSSRRQPPRGKPTLPRPLRLPSAGPEPVPRA